MPTGWRQFRENPDDLWLTRTLHWPRRSFIDRASSSFLHYYFHLFVVVELNLCIYCLRFMSGSGRCMKYFTITFNFRAEVIFKKTLFHNIQNFPHKEFWKKEWPALCVYMQRRYLNTITRWGLDKHCQKSCHIFIYANYAALCTACFLF